MGNQDRTIIVSDIHISNGEKYAWFKPPYSEEFVARLEKTAADGNVQELVFLGDLFDLWLFPVDVVPWTVDKILGKYPDIKNALQKCVQNIPHVYYINGNHDMMVRENDLAPLNSGGKNVELISAEDYNKKYSNQRHIEHGHIADMFNAPPSNLNDTIGGYPLGFFITRLIAGKDDQSSFWDKLRDAIQTFFHLHQGMADTLAAIPEPYRNVQLNASTAATTGALLVHLIISAIQGSAGNNTRIRFSETALDNRFTVGQVQDKYNQLYDEWRQKYPNNQDLMDSMLSGLRPNGLDWYSKRLLANAPPQQILVLGHTHKDEALGAYFNDGCCCGPASSGSQTPSPTYVEIMNGAAKVNPF